MEYSWERVTGNNEIGMDRRAHKHTHTAFHTSQTHPHSVTPDPVKSARTVLSHHIWAVLTGDATGQSTATCALLLLLPLCPECSSFFPVFVPSLCIPPTLPFLHAYYVQLWYWHSWSLEKTHTLTHTQRAKEREKEKETETDMHAQTTQIKQSILSRFIHSSSW